MTLLYFFSNVLFIHILLTVWSKKSFETYVCPVLDKEVPLIVYIKNRRLFRMRRENRFAESTEAQQKEIKKDIESMNPIDIIENHR